MEKGFMKVPLLQPPKGYPYPLEAFVSCWYSGITREQVIMPIRISCRDKPLNGVQLIEFKEVNTPLASNLKASNMDRKAHFRILCGSV
jgi:hypothetical protein